jgi:hypothetical protein
MAKSTSKTTANVQEKNQIEIDARNAAKNWRATQMLDETVVDNWLYINTDTKGNTTFNDNDGTLLVFDANGDKLASIPVALGFVLQETEKTPAKQARKPKSAKKAPEEKVEKEDVTVTKLEYLDDDFSEVSIADLVPLDSMPIKGASYAMREINQNHLKNIRVSIDANEDMPPLTVVPTNLGVVVVDGYHRWAAYESYLKDTMGDSDTPIESVRKEFLVPVTVKHPETDLQVLQMAFEANLRHGLPATEGSRSRYGAWLFTEAEESGHPISVREAGRRALCSHVAVLKEMNKAAKKQQKMLDELVGPENAEDVADFDREQEREKTTKEVNQGETVMKSLVKASKYFGGLDMTERELDIFIGAYAEQMYKDEIEALQAALAILYTRAKDAPTPEQKELVTSEDLKKANHQ